MLTRRDFLQVVAATNVLAACGPSLSVSAKQQKLTQSDLLKFSPKGQVTLLHFTDCHAQLRPLYFREPSVNIGVGEAAGLPPHITGEDFLKAYGLKPGTPDAYAFSSVDFNSMAHEYGRIGGMDRMATLVKAVRAERPDNTLLLDGGDTWQGSYTSLKTGGEDMVRVMNKLGVDAMTSHWEFTFGAERVMELIEKLDFPFLAGNIVDTEWEEAVFEGTQFFERGGVNIAVIGQAFPYTPIANPRYMMPDWSFGIREGTVRAQVNAARKNGAELVVLLSHNGFDVDRKLASRVDGIDVILTGHTHDAIPAPVKVNNTLLIASGSHGKFLSRLDLDVKNGKVVDYNFALMPILSDAIEKDAEMDSLIKDIRAPHEEKLNTVLARTENVLYRRGNFNGTFDDVICDALLEQRDAEISLSPGFRWGSSLPGGHDIKVEDVYNQTAITYPSAYRNEMTGGNLRAILEDVADNIFNPDPYYQQGGDMVRVGGISYTIKPKNAMGQRISNLTSLKTGKPIEDNKSYVVAGWASVNEATQGPAIYDIVTDYLSAKKVVSGAERGTVNIVGM